MDIDDSFFKTVAQQTEGYSFADLEALFKKLD